MFLKRIRVKKNSKKHVYWALVKSVRTARGPRHEVVSYLGELSVGEQAGWAKVARVVDHQPKIRVPPLDPREEEGPVPENVEVKVKGVRVERTRDFGEIYLALLLWQALELDRLLEKLLPPTRKDVSWASVAAVLAIARFCKPSSELHIADSWYESTALADLLGVSPEEIYHMRLYRGLDRVLEHKEAIEAHLKDRFSNLFDAKFDLLLYDITSTYFEGKAERNPQAKRGYSRDKRFDCKQVCIGLIVTREGFPLGYEVFDGNRSDVTTVEDIVDSMEAKYGRANRIWVMDRGMISEENLEYLRSRNGQYIVGTPKSMLKKFEKDLLEKDWTEVEEGINVKLCRGPEETEAFVLCRSTERRDKEKAIHARFEKRIEAGLEKLARRLDRTKRRPDLGRIERQIGRLLGRNSRAAGLFDIKLKQVKRDGKEGFLKVTWSKREEWRKWTELSEGCYLLRTNLTDWAPEKLWTSYIQLTVVEAAFRTEKSELHIRPIWHQLEHRVQGHILFSFLAYAMWKVLEQWMARSGLGNGPRPLIEEIGRIKAQDVILPTSTGRELRIRCVTTPDACQRSLLGRLGLKIPTRLGEPRWLRKAKTKSRM
jgi:transposase